MIKALFSLIIFSSLSSAQAQAQPQTQAQSQAPAAIHTWIGKINGKYPVFIWLTAKDKVLKGQITYLNSKTKTPMALIGTIDEKNTNSVFEFQPDGTISGILELPRLNETLKGSWTSTATQKELSLDLKTKDTTLTGIDTAFTPTNIAGDYAYRYGDKGSSGFTSIKLLANNKCILSINAVTGPPAFNLAEIEPATVTIKNNEILYNLPDTKCHIRIKCFKGFMQVSDADANGCDFGLNASVGGIYYQIPPKTAR